MLDMALYLRDAGWAVTVLLPAASGPLLQLTRDTGLPHAVRPFYHWTGPGTWLGRVRRIAKNLAAVPRVAWFFHKTQFDAVYSHSLAAGVPAIAARLAGRPHVWHLHEFGPYQPDGPMVSFDLGERLSLGIIRWTRSEMVAVAAVIKETFEKRLPGMDFRVSYQPVPFVEAFSPEDAAAIAAIGSSDGPNIIYVGAVTDTKRQDEAIEAMAILKRKLPTVRLFLAGRIDPAYGADMEALAEDLDITESITYLGYVQNAPSLIGLCDISINCRRAEASPRSLVESMLAGTFVIASGQGGNIEVVRGGLGKLYEPGDADNLAAEILWAVDNPDEVERLVAHAKQVATDTRSEGANIGRYVLEIEGAITAAQKKVDA